MADNQVKLNGEEVLSWWNNIRQWFGLWCAEKGYGYWLACSAISSVVAHSRWARYSRIRILFHWYWQDPILLGIG